LRISSETTSLSSPKNQTLYQTSNPEPYTINPQTLTPEPYTISLSCSTLWDVLT
jgi:hypothetical protein